MLTKIPKFRRCVIQNFPFIEEDFDALTDYELLCKVVEYLNKVITSQNEVIDTANDLTEAFDTLQSFVANYFENLDVQEEINTKLDAMAESGELADIISQYLNSTAVFGYDTVADMKDGSNLVNGSFAKTLGYHAKNDNGGATYKIRTITNDDVIDEAKIIALNDSSNQLVAELIFDEYVTPEQFGAYGDGVHTDTTALQASITNGKTVVANGTYLITSVDLGDIIFNLNGKIYGKVNVGRNVTLRGGEIHANDNNPAVEIANTIDNPRYMGTLIDGVKIYPGESGVGIYVNATVYSLYNFNVENCEIFSGNYGIKIETGNSKWVTKSEFANIFLHTPLTAGIKTINGGSLTNLGDIVFRNVYAQYQSPNPTYFADIDKAKLHFYNCFCYDGIGTYQYNISDNTSRIFINDSIVYSNTFANAMDSITAPALANGDCCSLIKVGKNISALPTGRNGMMIPTASGTAGLALSSQQFFGFVGKAGTNISSSSKYSAIGFQNGRLSVGLSEDDTPANFKMVEVTTPYAGGVYTTATLPSGSNVKNGAKVWCSDIHMDLTYYSNKWYKPDGTEYTS